ncbi:MAG: PadR family transcriptional regulator [Anaerolineae bacterium]|nr:PadR family transcriptional regulator [Anaerolineae bacterium]
MESKIQFVILGLLLDRPMNGYQLKQTMEVSTSNFLKPSYGNIYPTLKTMAKKGYVLKEKDESTAKVSSLYSVTDKGFEHFRKWLLEPIDDLLFGHNHLLQLFFFRHLTEEERAKKIDQLIRLYQMEIEKLKALKEQIADVADSFQLSTLEYGLKIYAMNIEFYQLFVK